MAIPQNRQLLSIILVGLVGILAALVFLYPRLPRYSLAPVSQAAYDNLSFWGVPPDSLNDLVDKADLIVIGRVGPALQKGTFRGYQSGQMVRAEPTGDPNDGIVPYVDFRIEVEQVLLDDGTMAAGKPVILRSSGKRAEPVNPDDRYPLPAPGDRHLFFLTATPDHTAYGHYYFSYSRLMIDGPVVTLSDGPRTILKLNDMVGVVPQEFIRAVRMLAQIKADQSK